MSDGINLKPLAERTGELIPLHQAVMYASAYFNGQREFETQTFKNEQKNNPTTLLVFHKPQGKKFHVEAESLQKWLDWKKEQKRGGLGRGPNPDGVLYQIRLHPSEYALISEVAKQHFNKEFVDVAAAQKAKLAAKEAKKAATTQTVA